MFCFYSNELVLEMPVENLENEEHLKRYNEYLCSSSECSCQQRPQYIIHLKIIYPNYQNKNSLGKYCLVLKCLAKKILSLQLEHIKNKKIKE